MTPSSEPYIDELPDGAVVIVQRWRTAVEGPVEVWADLRVAVTDGYEGEAPVGAALPVVHSWSTADGEVHASACVVDGPAEVELRVRHVPDTVTDIAVSGRLSAQVT